MRTPSSVACVVIALVSLSACSSKPGAQASVATPSAAVAASALQPASSHAAAPVSAESVTGPVLETMDSGGYTYVRVRAANGDVWAATTVFKVAVGDVVVVPLENPMANFRSETLKRDFPVIYFAGSITRPGEAAAMAQSAPPAMGTPPPVVPQGPVEVIPPVAGSVSVASIVTNSKSMAGKTVTVRGKVVKYNGAIMGLNWLHIQDGSGSVKDGTGDITVTTNAVAKVGDIVTITGTVVVDKDFGSGYSYAVLLQNATIK